MNMADTLNLGCLCSTLQRPLLRRELQSPGLEQSQDLDNTHPHLFSATPVFIAARDYELIERSVETLHRVTALPGYQFSALNRAPAIAAQSFGPLGVFMGYDFHIGAEGPRLIEINTNAGGALLHAAAARAHRGCCTPLDGMFGGAADLARLDDAFMAMFRAEWRAQRGDAVLRSVVITDDAPGQQYLAPEFELARRLFQAQGLHAVIADPLELQWRDGALWHPGLPQGMPVDLVYNRLTDFYFSDANHASLRHAYAGGAAVVTPHPQAHALHADKRNLVTLCDDASMAAWGASPHDRELLRTVVPHTQLVTAGNADFLWSRRKQLFFKPAAGYGSRAAYRGDKLTRRVWTEIAGGDYVAQALVIPGERMVAVKGEPTRLKVDVRAYAYDGRIQLLAARTYTGQTTNFRTEGGGFSPVVVLPEFGRADDPAREQALAGPCEC